MWTMDESCRLENYWPLTPFMKYIGEKQLTGSVPLNATSTHRLQFFTICRKMNLLTEALRETKFKYTYKSDNAALF